jgi:adenosylcobyric acid synthase|tara:strand:+ start:2018 stop:3490 length:1473 start_codon:yes stop_codon:yes gene_type:complete
MKTKSLMIQGTTSYAGKTFMVAVLCRIFRDAGYKVAPFKSQNTSLNSYVTPDGLEISRAQALQALASGIEPEVNMNPVLVKPMGESKAQVILNGKPFADMEAGKYYRDFAMSKGMKSVKRAYEALSKEYEMIIIEGAGSPAEINLYDRDIANMRIADLAEAPVILVADIDRGGVFASIYGTYSLLREEHQNRLKGVIINKFRGDLGILEPGLREIEKLTYKPVIGVIPYIHDLKLPFEDSVSLNDMEEKAGSIDIAVLKFPRISNFTDLDPFIYDGAQVRYIDVPEKLGSPDIIILPGSKNTFQDLDWLNNKGFSDKIKGLQGQSKIIGLCGGYQMLGNHIIDESGVEKGVKGKVKGLGLLDIETTFEEYSKTTRRVEGKIISNKGIFNKVKGSTVKGYEIHMGNTTLGKDAESFIQLKDSQDGAINKNGDVFGTYLHGIFDLPPLRIALSNNSEGISDTTEIWSESLGKAAEIVKQNLDLKQVYKIMGL